MSSLTWVIYVLYELPKALSILTLWLFGLLATGYPLAYWEDAVLIATLGYGAYRLFSLLLRFGYWSLNEDIFYMVYHVAEESSVSFDEILERQEDFWVRFWSHVWAWSITVGMAAGLSLAFMSLVIFLLPVRSLDVDIFYRGLMVASGFSLIPCFIVILAERSFKKGKADAMVCACIGHRRVFKFSQFALGFRNFLK